MAGVEATYKYTNQTPHLFPVAQNGRTYLIYAGYGLGDVYELEQPEPLDAPTNFTATGTGATSVSLTWSAVDDAAQYEVFRDGTIVGKTSATSLLDDTVLPDGAYAYSVRALAATGAPSPSSATDTATTIVFTDAQIVPGMTVKAAHITDLRRAALALSTLAGLEPPSFTDPDPKIVKRIHLEELARALGAPAFSTSATIRAADIENLRALAR